MNRLNASDNEKLNRLALHEGWEVFREKILQYWVNTAKEGLARAEFDNLLKVGRLQGEIQALERIIRNMEGRRKGS